jgi:hypothetical protein
MNPNMHDRVRRGLGQCLILHGPVRRQAVRLPVRRGSLTRTLGLVGAAHPTNIPHARGRPHAAEWSGVSDAGYPPTKETLEREPATLLTGSFDPVISEGR